MPTGLTPEVLSEHPLWRQVMLRRRPAQQPGQEHSDSRGGAGALPRVHGQLYTAHMRDDLRA